MTSNQITACCWYEIKDFRIPLVVYNTGMADNLVELPSLSKWPQSPVFKPIDQLSEIYFLDRVWKTVEVTYLQSVLNVVDESAAGFEPCKAILEVRFD